MRRGVMVLVVLFLVAGVALMLRDEPDVAPRGPTVEMTGAATSAPPAAEQVTPPVDAAAPNVELPRAEASVETVIKLLKGDAPAVGERVTLVREGTEVSGLIDVVGMVKLPLAEGAWRVVSPAHVDPQLVFASPLRREVTLKLLPRAVVSGCVTDEAGKPAPNALVSARSAGESDSTRTGPDGCFVLEVNRAEAELHAETRGALSPWKTVLVPASRVTLVLTRVFPWEIHFEPGGPGWSIVRVSSRVGVQQITCRDGAVCRAKLPNGDFAVEAAGERQGRLVFGRRDESAASAPGKLRLQLSDAPPISGVVRDLQGRPVQGVGISFFPLGFPGVELGAAETDVQGRFSVQPQVREAEAHESFPVWGLGISREIEGPAAVALGDAPLELVVK